MAQIVKLRRSSVSGQKPTNSNLQLGELALNTTDGKVYMAKSGSLGPSVEELISTNTVNTGSIFITGNVTASNFSGSFKGDGSKLYNIPSSGVTGLELNKIVDGSATASISQTDGLRINTKTEITGSVYITDYLTVSGSMTLGSGLDSYLMFKGVISSSLAPDSDGDTHYIGGPNRKWAGIYGKTGSFTRLSNYQTPSSSIIIERASVSGSFTGSYIGDGIGLYNIPFHISGSDVSGTTYNKTFTKLQFDDSTGLNVEEINPGTAFISIGSHFKDIFVSGSPILSATGSDAFEIIPLGGVEVYTSITDTNANGYVKELTISTTNLSSSLNNRMDTITGSINSLNNFSSSVVLTSQTGSMTVLSASYAVTAAFALNAGAGGGGGSALGSYSSLEVTSAASTWSFAHNSGQQYPIFQVFDSNGFVVIPSQIRTIDEDLAEIIFPSPQTGIVIASLGGGNGTTQEFINSNLWTVNHNLGTDYPDVTVWDSNRNIIFPNRIESVDANQIKIYFSMPVSGHVSVSRGGHILSGSAASISGLISGSSQISNLGYATTGSNTFVGSQTINGCLTINNAKICSTGVTLSSNTEIFNLSSFDGAFFDYVVKNGANMRAGSIMSAWNGTDSTFNETTTMDLGNTNAIGFNVSGTGRLNATVSSGTWLVEVLYRALGSGIIQPTATPIATLSPTATPVPSATPTPSPTSIIIPSSGCWENIIINVTTAGDIKYRVDSCGSVTSGYLTAYFGLGEYTMLPCLDISTLSPDEGHSPAVFTIISSGTSCFAPTPTPTATLIPTATPTPTPTSSNTNYMISATGSTAPNYCDGLGGPFTISIYGDSNVWTSVTRFYTDSGMITPFNGNSLYYGDSEMSSGTTLQIDSSGYVIDFYAC